MRQRQRTADEIRKAGLVALYKALGQADTLRFLQQFDPGKGDYTREREQLLGRPSVAELIGQITRRKSGNRHKTKIDARGRK